MNHARRQRFHGAVKRGIRISAANAATLRCIGCQNRAVVVRYRDAGVGRHRYLRVKTQMLDVQRSKSNALDGTLAVEHGHTKVNGRPPGDTTNLVIAHRERPRCNGALKVGPVREISLRLGGQRIAQDFSVGVQKAHIGVIGVSPANVV